jgi:4-diphosphocytidyl-2-C-methyl-D-erythritol kinase
MRLKAYAKLNLSLRVFETRPDGFHRIESIMQSISLCDYVTLTPIASGIEVTCSDPSVPTGSENIAYKAAELFLKTQNTERGTRSTGIKIHIEKHIPMAAGLAGGSADAAAVLYGMNQLQTEDQRLQTEDLLKIGAQIGSDVPFCLTGGTCLVEGRGEILTPQEAWPQTFFVLVYPEFQVSTKWAYETFDVMSNGQFPMSNEGSSNDLEPVVASKFEEVIDIKERLLKLGCISAQMSGSGSSVFGIIGHEDKVKAQAQAEEILDKIIDDYPHSFVVETVDRGIEEIKE